MAGAASSRYRSVLIRGFATTSRHPLPRSVTPRPPRLPCVPLTRYSVPCFGLHFHGQHPAPPRSFISTQSTAEDKKSRHIRAWFGCLLNGFADATDEERKARCRGTPYPPIYEKLWQSFWNAS